MPFVAGKIRQYVWRPYDFCWCGVLVAAHGSEPCVRKDGEVRLFSPALILTALPGGLTSTMGSADLAEVVGLKTLVGAIGL